MARRKPSPLDPSTYGLPTDPELRYPTISAEANRDDLTIPWLTLAMWLLGEAEPMVYSGAARKYVPDVSFTIPGDIWARGWSVSLGVLGYGGKSKNPEVSKLSRLSSIYLNKESAAAAREKLAARIAKREEISSVTVSMIGGEKDKRSQGHCMASTIITYVPRPAGGGEPLLRATIFYRVTESLRKFGADLAFLQRIALPAMLPDNAPPLSQVEFRFSNIYLSPVYMPTIWGFVDPAEMLAFYKRGPLWTPDQIFYRQISRQNVWPAIYPEKTYSYRERQLMHDIGKAHIADGTVDGAALKKFVKDCGEYVNDALDEEED